MKSTGCEPKHLPARKAMGGPNGPPSRLVDAPTYYTSILAVHVVRLWYLREPILGYVLGHFQV